MKNPMPWRIGMRSWAVGMFVLAAGTVLAAENGGVVGYRFDGSSVYPDARMGAAWRPEKRLLWRTPMPTMSNGSAVPIGDRVFVGVETHTLVCLDAETGSNLWQQSMADTNMPGVAKAKMPTHSGTTGWTIPTPVSDGKLVWGHTSFGSVAGFTLTGERKWVRFLQTPQGRYGHGSSPVLAEGKLLVHMAPNLYALDPETGRILWNQAIPARPVVGTRCPNTGACQCKPGTYEDETRDSTFGSPVITTLKDGNAVVILHRGDISRVRDGLHLTKVVDGSWFTSPIVSNGILYAHSEGGARAYRLPERAAEPFVPEELWFTPDWRDARLYSTGVHQNGLLFYLGFDYFLYVADAGTGQLVKKIGTGMKGSPYPALLIVGDLLLACLEFGNAMLLTADRAFQPLAKFGFESFSGTPTISRGWL
jgi:outer membrane protein assembly factor BamB